jgi:nitrate/TMAO reductase-like tetraheme cytochrome c subunit
MKNKLPSSFYNPVTLAGAGIATLSLLVIFFLFLVELLSGESSPYIGILAFIILPAVLILGLLMIIFGIIRENKRRKSGHGEERRFPVIDFNDPRYRFSFVIFVVGTVIFLLLTALGSFKAYEYTESDEFCGTVCHTVMEPEFTAYQGSPHARVGCVQCHIGSGADWFVKSKLSGAYQLYSVTFNKYSRPIPTPIENLRPAQQTCEQCHWPSHFFSEKLHPNTYFHTDENNSRWSLNMLMKVGGGNDETGVTSGIHWHMNINNEITYISTDESRMVIPWIKVKSKNGEETIYRSTEVAFNNDDFKKGVQRRMDCIDCHNRPSHQYHPASSSVNHFMSSGDIDASLPYIKSIAVDALEASYRTKPIALDSIRIKIESYYKNNYPSIAASNENSIARAIESVQKIYSRNYFPEMKVSWKAFPDQIGHMFAPGCFRCHDGKHVSETGKVISRDCNVCHTILSQEFENQELALSLKGVEYKHPVDIGGSWEDINCSNCHGANR